MWEAIWCLQGSSWVLDEMGNYKRCLKLQARSLETLWMQQRFLGSSALSGILLCKACEGKMNRAIEDSVCQVESVWFHTNDWSIYLILTLRGCLLYIFSNWHCFAVIGIALQASYVWTSCVTNRGHAIRLCRHYTNSLWKHRGSLETHARLIFFTPKPEEEHVRDVTAAPLKKSAGPFLIIVARQLN